MDFSVIFGDFSNALSHHCTVAWVTRPERPKGVKNVIKQGPLDFCTFIFFEIPKWFDHFHHLCHNMTIAIPWFFLLFHCLFVAFCYALSFEEKSSSALINPNENSDHHPLNARAPVLTGEVAPLFRDRGGGIGDSRSWIEMMVVLQF